jgi:hypothetical protein
VDAPVWFVSVLVPGCGFGCWGAGFVWVRCWVLRKRAPVFWGWFFLVRHSLGLVFCVVGFRGVGGLFFEFCIVDASIFFLCFVCLFWCSQVVEGAWWMPWHQGPMKDVGACDIPRGAGNQAVIRGFPNGVTWHSLWGVAAA